jgi:hypothetical protein
VRPLRWAAVLLCLGALLALSASAPADARRKPRPPKPTPIATTTPAPTPTPTVTASPTPTTTATASGSLLIKHGQDIPSPSFLRANAARMDTMPFDGVVLTMGSLSSATLGATPISVAQYAANLGTLPTLTRLRHNFVIVYAPASAYIGDWSVAASNAANLATAAKAAGFVGIVYDSERYFGGSDNWPTACALTLAECQTGARARGAQVGAAIRGVWPDAVILSLYGPWVSDPSACQNTGGAPCNDVSFANELMGPFVAGLSAVDGGEVYTLRTPSQFAAFHAYQRSLSPSAGFGVFDSPWLGVPMDEATWTTTLRNALAATDRYVWAYTERHDWWGTGWPSTPVPTSWVDATRAAQ